MNEGFPYEHDNSGERPDPTFVIKETLLDTIINRHDRTISYPEILAYTDMDIHTSVNNAIIDLKASDLITEDLFVSPITNNAFPYYQLNWQIPDVIEPTVSAHATVSRMLDEYNNRISKSGVASLNAQEWCLRSIFEYTHESIQSGQMLVPLSAIGWKMIHDLKDEGIEKWLLAYRNASAQASELLQKHFDSE